MHTSSIHLHGHKACVILTQTYRLVEFTSNGKNFSTKSKRSEKRRELKKKKKPQKKVTTFAQKCHTATYACTRYTAAIHPHTYTHTQVKFLFSEKNETLCKELSVNGNNHKNSFVQCFGLDAFLNSYTLTTWLTERMEREVWVNRNISKEEYNIIKKRTNGRTVQQIL